ncbi:MAG TPA: competence protein TfoX [Afipia sp.]|uniref:TfoX/Sxy family protein n=1 Tax=unclassified Afipia TaxID=2642050 RepID=UPI0004655FAB|nr:MULTISPECIES: TfoX/Sxy family protein [unclassified Afipia]MAH71511.1 competence protein TfoX [Afipia sp.]OUX59352.1 MAG: competence protein TfoX [Afipia sp. TMED4]HAP11491.1 competence protein TfoX [Afipia sp.]HAP48901.1 competence protein TfoX [Afipia sp.]HAQ92275.1 competence protein TfoX [Afipia sp.]
MDRDYLIDLFSEFGPVVLRRMFSGYGIVADDVNFAMALRAGIIFRVDEQTEARYEAEGAKPFQYETRNKTVIVKSYRHLPERLYDDPEELAVWAREAVGAAKRAAAKKAGVKKRSGQRSAPAKAAPRKSGTAKKAKPPAAKKAALKTAGRKTSPKRLLVKKR